MRLRDLAPRFVKHGVETVTWTRRKPDGTDEEVTGPRNYLTYVDTLVEADGIIFLCPKCFTANGGSAGTHAIICWTPGVPLDVPPRPGRWGLAGTNFDDLSLFSSQSSVQLEGSCNAHFFIENGAIRMV